MTIKVTKTQTVEEEREITLPYFCKEVSIFSPWLYMVTEDKKVVRVAKTGDNYHLAYYDGIEDIGKAEPITEEEFDAAFNQAMNQLKQYQKEVV